MAKKARAEAVLKVCIAIVGIAVLMFFSLPDTLESSFAGMAILFGVMICWPLLLIPVIGIALAVFTKYSAEAQLRKLRSHAVGKSEV